MLIDTKIYTESFSCYKLMIRFTLGNIVIILTTFTIFLNRFFIANSNN